MDRVSPRRQLAGDLGVRDGEIVEVSLQLPALLLRQFHVLDLRHQADPSQVIWRLVCVEAVPTVTALAEVLVP